LRKVFALNGLEWQSQIAPAEGQACSDTSDDEEAIWRSQSNAPLVDNKPYKNEKNRKPWLGLLHLLVNYNRDKVGPIPGGASQKTRSPRSFGPLR